MLLPLGESFLRCTRLYCMHALSSASGRWLHANQPLVTSELHQSGFGQVDWSGVCAWLCVSRTLDGQTLTLCVGVPPGEDKENHGLGKTNVSSLRCDYKFERIKSAYPVACCSCRWSFSSLPQPFYPISCCSFPLFITLLLPSSGHCVLCSASRKTDTCTEQDDALDLAVFDFFVLVGCSEPAESVGPSKLTVSRLLLRSPCVPAAP